MENMTLHAAQASQRPRSAAARAGRYAADGVVRVDGLLPTSEVDLIRAAFMDQVVRDRHGLAARDGLAEDDVQSRYPRFMQPHRRPGLPVGVIARRLMTDRRVLDVVTELIGPAFGAHSMFYFKPPTARGQAPHQHNYFLRAHPETCLAVWIAVDAAPAVTAGRVGRSERTSNGCD